MTCPHHRAMKPGRKDSNPSHLAPELAILEGQCLSGVFEGWGILRTPPGQVWAQALPTSFPGASCCALERSRLLL